MNYFKTALLLAALTGFVLVAGYLLGGQSGLVIALVAALGMNLFAYWNSDKMVLRMSNAQEVGPNEAPELFGIVQGLGRERWLGPGILTRRRRRKRPRRARFTSVRRSVWRMRLRACGELAMCVPSQR